MRRDQLAHILRAAATIVHDGDILVIGSQSILGSFDEDDLPDRAVASMEADVAFFDDPNALKADLVDGVIGEMSAFHDRGVGTAAARIHRPGVRSTVASTFRAQASESVG